MTTPFLKAFYKRASLKGILPDHLFEKLVNKKILNRAKLMQQEGNTIRHYPDLKSHGKSVLDGVKKLFNKDTRMEGARSLHEDLKSAGNMTMPDTMGSDRVSSISTSPELLAKSLGGFRAKLPPTFSSHVLNHELDEASHFSRKGIEGVKNSFSPMKHDLLSPIRKKISRAAVAKIIKTVRKKDKTTGPIISAVTKMHPAVRTALKGGKQTGNHFSPEIIMHESNSMFHEADNKTKELFTKMRTSSNEKNLMQRSGLRYGDEYIAPGGRRWNKLVKRISAENDRAPKDISSYKEELKGRISNFFKK